MSKFWGKLDQVLPIVSICLSFSLSVEASILSKIKQNSLSWQNKINLENTNRQENLIDNFTPKIDKNKTLIAQINTVKQLRDIQATDWSYQALKNLIERYGCIAGFPTRTPQAGVETSDRFSSQVYRGSQNISRAEFAAGLNACLTKIENIIANFEDVPQDDVETLLRLMQEFQSDLAVLQGRTDGSQARLQDLEAVQFSTTSKLRGEAVFGLSSILSGNDDDRTIFGSRLRLELQTSFKGEDLLFTRFSRSNFSGFESEIGTFQGNLSFTETDDDDFSLDTLYYSFGVGDRLDFIVGVAGLEADDIAPTINFLDGDGGSGSISAFGTRNPVYYPPGDAGIGVTHNPIDQIQISAGYIASPANEPSPGNGLFNGAYSALGQITIAPIENLSLAATYVHSFNQSDTETGTNLSNLQSFTADLFGSEIPTVSNSYGLELSWAINNHFVIGGWGGLSKVSNLSTINQGIDRGTQDIWNWSATLALPDLGREGSLGGIVVGSEPTVTDSSIVNLEADSDRSLHLEAFYQYQVNDNISITPGVIWITEPDGDIQDGDNLVIGTVRTTFSF